MPYRQKREPWYAKNSAEKQWGEKAGGKGRNQDKPKPAGTGNQDRPKPAGAGNQGPKPAAAGNQGRPKPAGADKRGVKDGPIAHTRFEEDGESTRPQSVARGRQGRRNQFDGWSKNPQSRPSVRSVSEEPPRQKSAVAVEPPQPAEENASMLIFGRNPVREAIKSGKSIDKIYISEVAGGDGSLREIMRMAKDRALVVIESSRKKLDELTLPFGYNGKSANHQGVVAQLPECQYVEIADIINSAKEKRQEPFVLVLDSIMDPYNLGSIIRSAECAGVHGIIIPKRRAVGVTAAVAKASAGAVLYANIARVPSLVQAVETLKRAGLWIAGADVSGTPMAKASLAGPLALVIGAEGGGLSRLIKEKCDFLVGVPLKGNVESLNASVAAAILLFEKVRHDE